MSKTSMPPEIKRFYNSKAWRKKRKYILQRDKYMCQHCLQVGKIKAANTVHHKKEYKTHPHLGLDDTNLVSLCFWCHEETKKKDRRTPNDGAVRIIKM